MKKILLFLLLSTGSTLTWAQWNYTYDINANSVFQLPSSNSMVEVTSSSPNQVWTVLPMTFGTTCGNRIWAHKVNASGTTLGAFEISTASEVNLDAMAIEEYFGDMFIGGSMEDCNTGNKDGFILSLTNTGSFASAVRIPGGKVIEIMDIIPVGSSNFMAIGFIEDSQWGFDPISIVFDQSLTVLSTQVYHIPGDNLPHQGVLNPSGNVSIVGTEINTASDKLFTMNLTASGGISGVYKTYSRSGSAQITMPSVCVQNNDLLITAGIDIVSGTSDILVMSMNHNTRAINWAKSYDFNSDDEGLQVFNEGGDIAVSFGSQSGGNIFHGLMFLDVNGNFSSGETYSSYNTPLPFATIQSSASTPTYFQAGFSGSTLNLVEESSNVMSSCVGTWTTTGVIQNFTDNQTPYASASLSSQPMTFYVGTISGVSYDCMGFGATSFKKSATSIGSVDDLGLAVFPTASNDIINFNLKSSQNGSVRVLSMQGKVLYMGAFKDSQGTVDISDLAVGQYVLSVNSQNGESRSLITKL